MVRRGCPLRFAWSVNYDPARRAGAHFHLSVIGVNLPAALAEFQGERWATLPRARATLTTVSLYDARATGDTALVPSVEGHGPSEGIYPVLTWACEYPDDGGH